MTKKRHEKKCIKSRLDPCQLRLQRIVYMISLRNNKRDLILEEKRHVLEKINWTTAWDDDEDDDLEGINISEQDIVTAFLQLSSNVKECLSNLLYCLDLLRKMLCREMKTKFGAISSVLQETPGVLANMLLQPKVLEQTCLLMLSTCKPKPLSVELSVCREITSILKEITRFKGSYKDSLFRRDDLVDSLIEILENEKFDMICHTNVFIILNNTVCDNSLTAHHLDLIGQQVISHLKIAITVYGPEDAVIQGYIQSITLFMSSLVSVISTLTSTVIDSERINDFFTSTMECLTQLIHLNDPEVTVNVLNFVHSMIQIPIGADVMSSHSSKLLIDDLLVIVSSSHSYSSIVLNILSFLSSRDDNFSQFLFSQGFYQCLPSFMTASSVSVARLLTSFCSLGPSFVWKLMTSCGNSFRPFIDDALYFGDKKTQKEVISLLFTFTKFADPQTIWSVFDKELAEMMKECLSREDLKMTCLILDTFFNIVQKSSSDQRTLFVKESASILMSFIEAAYNSGDSNVSHSAAKLLDFYTFI